MELRAGGTECYWLDTKQCVKNVFLWGCGVGSSIIYTYVSKILDAYVSKTLYIYIYAHVSEILETSVYTLFA